MRALRWATASFSEAVGQFSGLGVGLVAVAATREKGCGDLRPTVSRARDTVVLGGRQSDSQG